MQSLPKKSVLIALAMTVLLAALVLSVAMSRSSHNAPSVTASADSSSAIRTSTSERATFALGTGRFASVPNAWTSEANALMERNLFAVISYESARVEAERLATEAEAAKSQARNLVVPAPNPSPVASGSCANPIVPEAVAMRESGCNWLVVNPTGCSGRSCLGFFQLDAGHFYAVSPWNPNVSGSCYGLGDWHDPAVQIACASRLGPGAWG